ncbi:ABC transporter substrate-binding protein [Sphingorhabdus sp. Alg239-R122]|uniref:ABC transporter substrate-binding protein n=1 Tax=Sphingorhabdus sp. Alg239-R122 TaxID=2305989 RepID=UPI0013DA30A9|nr:ABC transporter substrate-binding protein [Sphingorhabdus sp. Alg239-R122]
MKRLLLPVSLLLTACSGGERQEAPEGELPSIVSINPCTDAILAEVADPAQILAISHYSHDPQAASMPLEIARRYPAISGSVEEVLALEPDIVIAGGHVSPAAVDALDRLGIVLVQAPVANSVEESDAAIRSISAAIGRTEQGEKLVRRIAAALDENAPQSGGPVPALVWQGGGLVPGGGTLIDDLLSRAGFDNVAEDHGLAMWDVLGLEYLVDNPPRVLLSSTGSVAQEDRMLGHPALKHLEGQMKTAQFDQSLIFCGGPTIIRAAERLAAIRREVKE